MCGCMEDCLDGNDALSLNNGDGGVIRQMNDVESLFFVLLTGMLLVAFGLAIFGVHSIHENQRLILAGQETQEFNTAVLNVVQLPLMMYMHKWSNGVSSILEAPESLVKYNKAPTSNDNYCMMDRNTGYTTLELMFNVDIDFTKDELGAPITPNNYFDELIFLINPLSGINMKSTNKHENTEQTNFSRMSKKGNRLDFYQSVEQHHPPFYDQGGHGSRQQGDNDDHNGQYEPDHQDPNVGGGPEYMEKCALPVCRNHLYDRDTRPRTHESEPLPVTIKSLQMYQDPFLTISDLFITDSQIRNISGHIQADINHPNHDPIPNSKLLCYCRANAQVVCSMGTVPFVNTRGSYLIQIRVFYIS